jgi:hypothetical protein
VLLQGAAGAFGVVARGEALAHEHDPLALSERRFVGGHDRDGAALVANGGSGSLWV